MLEKKLDVSDLPPPEPLELAVEAIHQLAPGEYLHMIHRKEPCLLYPILEEQGFAQKTSCAEDGSVHILIWHQSDQALAAHLMDDKAGTPQSGAQKR